MKTCRRIATAALAAALLAAPARAQMPQTITEQIRLETRDFAACIAEKRRDHALGLLGLSLSSPDYRIAMKRLLMRSRCVEDPDMATFEPLLLSGALAEIALKDGMPAQARAKAVAANPGDPALAMADCAVRADAAKADALLATDWLSTAELDAAHGLAPTLKPCIVDERITINAGQLRALIALAKLRSTAA